jgi:hypothetical protein
VLPILLLSVGLLLAGCSESTPPAQPAAPPQSSAPAPAPAPAPRVLETFNVGQGVYVRSLAVEPSRDALWVGTSAGVHEIDLTTREPRNTFTREHGLANEYVFAIGLDRDGNKWFGTNAGGVSRYRDGEWQVYFPMHGLADYWIYSFGEQADGSYWIGTWAGVNRYDPQSGEFTTYVEELVNEWVYAIGIDSKDRVWFGTEGGVSMLDGSTWSEWTHADGMGAGNPLKLPASDNTGLGTRRRHDLGILSGGQATYAWPATSSTASPRRPTAHSGSVPTVACRATTVRTGRPSTAATACSRTTSTRSWSTPRATCGQAPLAV